jgi:putative transposase
LALSFEQKRVSTRFSYPAINSIDGLTAINSIDGKGETMPFWRLYYHLAWATHNRQHLIQPQMEQNLYAYIVHKASESEVYVYAINGWFDHVHLIVAIPPKLAVATVVKRLKGASSHHLNHGVRLDYEFSWQRGYGALSLGERQRPQAEAYVHKQKDHHEQETTMAWLERFAEFDEGPNDTGLAVKEIPAVLRETAVAYSLNDAPF